MHPELALWMCFVVWGRQARYPNTSIITGQKLVWLAQHPPMAKVLYELEREKAAAKDYFLLFMTGQAGISNII